MFCALLSCVVQFHIVRPLFATQRDEICWPAMRDLTPSMHHVTHTAVAAAARSCRLHGKARPEPRRKEGSKPRRIQSSESSRGRVIGKFLVGPTDGRERRSNWTSIDKWCCSVYPFSLCFYSPPTLYSHPTSLHQG
ncbi:unnamed protein product [Sympodiomycopsis kandeliae]